MKDKIPKFITAIFFVVILIASAFAAITPVSANPNQVFFLDSNVFGPNQVVSVSGDIDYISSCPTGGIPDGFPYSILPVAYIYVVDNGAVSGDSIAALTDVSNPGGIPNTVVSSLMGGGFIDEIIAMTGPTGNLMPNDLGGPGVSEYDIIIDECQNGLFDPGVDYILGEGDSWGFLVNIPPEIPQFPSTTIQNIKNNAGAQKDSWRDLARDTALMFIIYDVYTFVSAAFDPIDFLLLFFNPLSPSPAELLQLQFAVINQEIQQSNHWAGIEADPPDPTFTQFAELGPVETFTPNTGSRLEAAVVDLGNNIAEESAILEALKISFERFQGAREAGNAEYSLLQAEEVKKFSDMLVISLGENNLALSNVANEIQNTGIDLNAMANDLIALQNRVNTVGFTADEIEIMHSSGMEDGDIELLKQNFLDEEYTAFQENGDILSQISAELTLNNIAIANFQNLSSDATDIINSLSPSVEVNHPTADPNGPYFGDEGSPITFDGTGSSDPNGDPLTYAWDFGSDGAFDDGTGDTPEFTYYAEFSGLIGLRVTDTTGLTDTAYAKIMVTSVNDPPTIDSFTPEDFDLIMSPGDSLTFSVTASDPDGDPLNYSWTLNDVEVSTTNSFTFMPDTTNVGFNMVKITISDGNILSRDTFDRRAVTVTSIHDINVSTDYAPETNGIKIKYDGTEIPASESLTLGNTYDIYYKIVNEGDYNETANVSVIVANSTWTQTVATHIWSINVGEYHYAPGGGDSWDTSGLTPGDYNITVNASIPIDNDWSNNERIRAVTLAVPPNQPPVSDPNGPYIGTEGIALTFNGSGSYDPDGSIVSYDWDFGDGNTSSEESPTHTYAQNGTYTVTLNVTDDDGTTDINTTTATIADTEPTADFFGIPTSGLKPLTVNFTDASASYDGIAAWEWEFGDGNTSSDQNPTHLYANAGLYNVTLTVHEADGNSDTETKVDYITVTEVNQPPVADPNGPYTGTEGVAIAFNGSGSYDPDGSIASYAWDFGDGNTSSVESPTHTYAQNGTYTVTLNVTDGDVATDINTTTATIADIGPIANFAGIPTSGLKPLTVNFTDNSTPYDGIVAWEWEFGDGNTSSEQNPNHVYTTEGIYTVALAVYEDDGDSHTETKVDYINVTRVNQPPVSDPNGPYIGTEGVTIAFNGSGSYDPDGSIASYDWDFGDGNTSNEENPTHTYAQNGTYTVTLNVTDDDGATDINTTTATIADTEPTADFFGIPASGLKPLTVNFTDNSTTYDGIATWEWDFGDGNTSSDQNPTHVYANEGLYNVTLTVYEADGDGDSDTETKVDYIIVTEVNQPPVADPNGPYTGTEGIALTFNGSGSYDPDGSIASYDWDFGDGNTSSEERPTHTYAQNGTYTVTLNVTDDDGATDINTTTATIADTEPTADFFGIPTSGLKPLTVNFTDNSTTYDGIVAWEWNFGDGGNSSDRNPTHVYVNKGLYNVTLTVYEGDGDSDIELKTDYINVIGITDRWAEINYELNALITKVNTAEMPDIIKRRLIDKLEYAKELKENAKIECEAGNFDGATKKLGVAKSQVQSFASMVKITRRISPEDKASFLAESTEIIGNIGELIEYIETEHKC
jgi:PKD repeat protein